ncbi:MAG: hypothetical protein C4547_14875 [Phycisphaerales bacterium]|nr:MAG: hypothetical protein C4547_14875 [Phycisphaerales bacterium]
MRLVLHHGRELRRIVQPLFLVVNMAAAICEVARASPPEGYEFIEIYVGYADVVSTPRMNDCGQVVYSVGDYASPDSEVFLYDNGVISQITRNSVPDAYPDINDDGLMAWMVCSDGRLEGEVVYLENGRITNLGAGGFPRINGLGHGAWWRVRPPQDCAPYRTLHFYDGDGIIKLTRGKVNDQGFVVNDDDDIVWTRRWFCPEPWTSQILLYRDGQIVRLPASSPQSQMPSINNLGQVAWTGDNRIELWDGDKPEVVTDWGRNPYLNNRGDMYFLRFHDHNRTWQGWLRTADGRFYQITDDPFWNADGDINDDMEICWNSLDLNSRERRIRYMRRIRSGEADFAGDVDLKDYAALAGCLTGPEWVERENPGPQESLCRCRFLDIDHDGDVDLADVALFQNAFDPD